MAALIRHTIAEGWLLLRRRVLVTLTLACALAVPLCLSGLTISLAAWLGPLVEFSDTKSVVPILLHPHLEDSQRQQWIDDQAAQHPEWQAEAIPPDQVAERLTHWFPYLATLLENDGGSLLPPLVEIRTDLPESVTSLAASPEVIAVGPTTSVSRSIRHAARRGGWFLGVVSAVLLTSAALLAAVWVHLELYRHADEITIMRLIGATESAIRGPFLVAVVAPGVVAALLSTSGTVSLTRLLSRLTTGLGLPPLEATPGVLFLEAGVACLLPLAAAMWILSRHSMSEFD